MDSQTRKLWDKQNTHGGDRERLFSAVAAAVPAQRVLYAGSFVDVAASFVFPDVTYVDLDARANKFFLDRTGVEEIISENNAAGAFEFIHADYSTDLGLEDESFDLLISLYAGFISEHCTHYLKVGGTLLVNPSHGDTAMASINGQYELTGVVVSGAGSYRVRTDELDAYLIPKKPQEITVERLHQLGRGIAYTKPAFAYLFRRTG